eukprot:4676580-Alexandrium_andersonii.AAC.1
MAPIGRRPQEGSEGPLWRGASLCLGCLGHRQTAHVTTYPPSCYDLAGFLVGVVGFATQWTCGLNATSANA